MKGERRYTLSISFWVTCAVVCLPCAVLCLYHSWLDYISPLPWGIGQTVRYLAAFLLPCAAILSARRAETIGRQWRGLELRRTSVWDAMMSLYAALVFLFVSYSHYARGMRRGAVSWFNVIGNLLCVGLWIGNAIRLIKKIKQSKTVPIPKQPTDN